MCGRYTHLLTWKELHRLLRLTSSPQDALQPRYNIAPTQAAPIVRAAADGAGREGVTLRWGLIPSWAKEAAIGNRMINARAETASEKPAFRAAFRRRRCLVPASGFYEWRKIPGSTRKQPHYIRPAHAPFFAFAGLWERWAPAGEAPIESFTILTTTPNELIRPIHDRMPVILPPAAQDRWLDASEEDAGSLTALLVPADAAEMTAHAVSTHVNSPRNDDEACIEPAPAP